VSTKEHIEYIKSLSQCSELDIEYLPQYAESIFEESNYKTIDNGVIDLMFAGNIGKAQSVDTIIKAANILKTDSRFMFHIVGAGSELDNCKKLAEELGVTNVKFYGNRPLSEMPEMYALADVMLVTLEDKPYANMTIPGKVQSYMAVGKPIIGAINGSCANFIINNDIGFVSPSENYYLLSELILKLDSCKLTKCSKKSKEIYFGHFSKTIFIHLLLKQLL
jgi:glycosyltransferase involved in cell wall biosynthesis